MRPDHDVDAVILLAMSLAAKRRPPELIEVIAALDAQGDIPAPSKIADAFYRLSQYGLVAVQDEGYTLTPYALNILSGQRKSAKHAERLLAIAEQLVECRVKPDIPPIELRSAQVKLIIKAHRESKKVPVKNLLATTTKLPKGTDKRELRRQSNKRYAERMRKE